jgi:hypothetical protein
MKYRALASGIVAALGVFVLLVPREASAALIRIESLESLAFEATAVVYTTRLSTVDAGPYAVASTYRVEKAYLGELHPGDTFTVNDDFYPATDPFGQERVADEGKRVFFLERRGAEATGWSIVGTGVRLVSSGRVYRYYQYSNPGGLAPTPEGEGRDRGPITFAAFEGKLAAALSRAERGHAALASRGDRVAFRRGCLELLGPPVLPRDASPDGDNTMAQEMLRALTEDKDVEGAIEILARTPQTSVSGFSLAGVHDALPRTTAMAFDTTRPIAVRVAAIEALDTFTAFDERYDVAPLAPLLADGAPDVRIAAIHAISAQARYTPPRKGQPEKSRRILLDDWKSEKDVWVELALVKALDWLEKPASVLPPRDPLFVAREGSDGGLELEYFATAQPGQPGILPPEVRYSATDLRGRTVEGSLEGPGFGYSTASGEGRFDLPLGPGVYRLTITAKFDFAGTTVERSARIDAFTVPPRAPSVAAVAAANEAGAVRRPRGCGGCTAADPEAALLVFLVPFVVLAFMVRRKKRTESR